MRKLAYINSSIYWRGSQHAAKHSFLKFNSRSDIVLLNVLLLLNFFTLVTRFVLCFDYIKNSNKRNVSPSIQSGESFHIFIS